VVSYVYSARRLYSSFSLSVPPCIAWELATTVSHVIEVDRCLAGIRQTLQTSLGRLHDDNLSIHERSKWCFRLANIAAEYEKSRGIFRSLIYDHPLSRKKPDHSPSRARIWHLSLILEIVQDTLGGRYISSSINGRSKIRLSKCSFPIGIIMLNFLAGTKNDALLPSKPRRLESSSHHFSFWLNTMGVKPRQLPSNFNSVQLYNITTGPKLISHLARNND
jgi:hypothetical protein